MIMLDSSFIVAYFNDDDELHSRAMEIAKDLAENKHGETFITDYIFGESISVLFSRTRNPSKVIITGDKLLEANTLLNTHESAFENSWGLFKTQKRHILSFTDCSTIAACKSHGIAELATFDKALGEASGLNVID